MFKLYDVVELCLITIYNSAFVVNTTYLLVPYSYVVIVEWKIFQKCWLSEILKTVFDNKAGIQLAAIVTQLFWNYIFKIAPQFFDKYSHLKIITYIVLCIWLYCSVWLWTVCIFQLCVRHYHGDVHCIPAVHLAIKALYRMSEIFKHKMSKVLSASNNKRR